MPGGTIFANKLKLSMPLPIPFHANRIWRILTYKTHTACNNASHRPNNHNACMYNNFLQAVCNWEGGYLSVFSNPFFYRVWQKYLDLHFKTMFLNIRRKIIVIVSWIA